MATEIVDKKKNAHEPASKGQQKSLNTFLWILVVLFFSTAAIGNIYFKETFSQPVRVVGVTILLVVAFLLAAITTQGSKARTFFKEAKAEVRKVVWPTRAEARQTTLIVVGITVLTSLFFWAIDSIIVAVITFLTNLRF